MADAIWSAVAGRFISIIEERIWKEVYLVRGFHAEVDKLSIKLKKTRKLLDDAERERRRTESASEWLEELEDACYEMEDVLDEWYTALRNFQIEQQENAFHVPGLCNFKWTSFIPIPSIRKFVDRRQIARKIQKVKGNIDSVLAERDQFVFMPTETSHSFDNDWRGQSTSFVDMAEIYGREIEREDLVRRVTLELLEAAGDQIQILSIVGVGGVGKTAVAQLVYHDTRVRECFQLIVWICVSDPFNEVKVVRNIIEIVTGNKHESNQFEFLLQRLKECVSGKKFLIVMDDVWTGESSKWKPLVNCLRNGNFGSKILVTTRNERVAKMIGSEIYNLRELSKEACWLLLQRIALSGRDGSEWEKFQSVGMKIANKCKGLPLAAKALGSHLYFKNSLEEWEDVLKSEIWHLEEAGDEIFRHLRLSYNDLSPTVKRCFSYCGVFPKDTVIDVETLIQQWRALGYLGSEDSGAGASEVRGREYFDKLATRSLFQDFEKDDLAGQIVGCKMHDIVHDFALLLRKNREEEAGSSSRGHVCSPAEVISGAKKYRSLSNWREPLCECVTNIRVLSLLYPGIGQMQHGMVPHEIRKFIHLRWLDLSGNDLAAAEDMKMICRLYNLQTLLLSDCNLKEIPKEIGNLIHLRDLNLSENDQLIELPKEIGNLIKLRHLKLTGNMNLKELPESLCDLQYLQTLKINLCASIFRLPEGLHRLANLKHLQNLHTAALEQYPEGLAQLSGLRTLSEFYAGSGRGKLGWLKNLNRLSGSLRLNVDLSDGSEDIVEDAREGELRNKDGLADLRIEFDGMLDGDREWVNLLDALAPHPNLLNLEIHSYGGSTLPSWMALNKLKTIRLIDFSELSSLPPLGRLPYLEEIYIVGIPNLEVVGQEFLGTNGSCIAFPKLKSLSFWVCDNLRELENITEASVMPCLKELNIVECQKLTALPHQLLASLSSLEMLDIRGSAALEIRYGERQGAAWKSISDACPRLRLRYSFCFDSIQHTTSHVELPADQINGRDLITVERTDNLVGRIVQDQTNQHLQIVSIVGVEEENRKTLAQVVYTDCRVRECFDLRIWINANFGLREASVAKAIIGSVTKVFPDSEELEDLLQTLRDCISGRKFFLVLDNVRMEEDSRWELLRTTLKNGRIGCMVLVTTREKSTAKMMGSLEDEIHTI